MGERRMPALSLQASSAGKQHRICLQRKAGRAVSETLPWKRASEEKASTSGPWVSCCPNGQFRAKPGQQPSSHLQGLAWLYPSLPSGEKWQEDRDTVGCWQRPKAGERLVVVPRPCRPSPARTPTRAQGLQPPGDLQLLKSKQSTCWQPSCKVTCGLTHLCFTKHKYFL